MTVSSNNAAQLRRGLPVELLDANTGKRLTTGSINFISPQVNTAEVQSSSTYIGADAQTVEDTVSTVIERQINGVEGMQYMTSTSGNDGSRTISTLFDPTSNRDIDQVNVQNRVAIAQPTLPQPVQQTGVTTETKSSSILLVYGFYAGNSEYDSIFLSNYVDLYITDAIKRVPGVGDATLSGERKYAISGDRPTNDCQSQ
jgi:HAE1 family hydrophobic/amphiphilic exporter-1